jgi:predicted nucleic acid-binding protein
MRLYLDTAPVIYTVENVPIYAQAVDNRLAIPGIVRVASDLTRMECRLKPLRDGNMDLLKDFDDYFMEIVSGIISLSREIMDRATEIRTRHEFKTPDAIHLAAACVSKCDVFFTNDHRLDRFEGISVEVIQPT